MSIFLYCNNKLFQVILAVKRFLLYLKKIIQIIYNTKSTPKEIMIFLLISATFHIYSHGHSKFPSFLRIWSHLLKKFLMENFIFSAVYIADAYLGPYQNIYDGVVFIGGRGIPNSAKNPFTIFVIRAPSSMFERVPNTLNYLK